MLDTVYMMRFRKPRANKLYLLTVVVVIAALAMYAGKALLQKSQDPARPVASTPEGRNEVRQAALKQMSLALEQYVSAAGAFPAGIPSVQTDICVSSGATCKAAHLVDLSILTSKGLLTSLPADPVGGHILYSCGYSIARNPSGTVTLVAPRAEKGVIITQVVQ